MNRIASNEGRMSLATAAIQRGQIQSGRAAAKCYNVPNSTLNTRLHGIQPKQGSRAKNRKLSEHEEEVLVSWVYSMEQRGYPPHIINVKRMAEALITSRGYSASLPALGKN
jgi:transposase